MIRLLEFHRSPNCASVRIALHYKGIPFVTEEMSAEDRAPMLKAVNWPLVPVILDGQVAMRDSEAILHYLESNYRDAPSLTPPTRDEIRQGEALRDVIKGRLRPVLGRAYGEAFKSPAQRDPAALKDVVDQLGEALQPVERALDGRAFLVGGNMSLYDIVIACTLMPARGRADYAEQSPMWAFFREHLSIPEGLRNVNAWLDRVLIYDDVAWRAPAAASA